MKKKRIDNAALKQKALYVSITAVLLAVVLFSAWNLVERRNAQRKAREAGYNFAKVLTQRAAALAEKKEWQAARLFAVNSLLYQAKAQKYMPPGDIRFPLEFHDWQLKYTLPGENYGMTLTPGGKFLVSGSGRGDTAADVHDLASGRLIKSLTGYDNAGSASFTVCISPDGKRLAAIEPGEMRINVRNVASGNPVTTLELRGARLLRFSPDSRFLAAGGSGAVNIWEIPSGVLVAELKDHDYAVDSLCFSPDGNLLASSPAGTADFNIILWDLPSFKQRGVLTGHSACVSSLCFSPDGKFLVSASWDNTVKVWQIDGLKEYAAFSHDNKVTSADVSPDGQFLASGSSDGTVRIRFFPGGEPAAILNIYKGAWAVRFTGKDNGLATYGPGNIIKVWRYRGHTDDEPAVRFGPDGKYPAPDVETVSRWVTIVENETGLVLDRDTPVDKRIYSSLDLDYYINGGAFNSAVEAYEAAEAFYDSGSAYLAGEYYEEAASAFDEALRIRPGFCRAINDLGWAYAMMGDEKKAEKIYKQAHALDASFYQDWNSGKWSALGDMYRQNLALDSAINAYKNALQINPRCCRAWSNLGEVLEARGRHRDAAGIYRKAVAAVPVRAQEWQGKIHCCRGALFLRQNRYNDAVEVLKKAIQLFPQSDRAWLRLADAYNNGEDVIYWGEPWDFYFNRTDLKRALIVTARQARVSFLIDPDVSGEITCRLNRVKWDRALDVFLKINDCEKCKIGDIVRVGRTKTIKQFLQAKAASADRDVKKFSGKPVDLSFNGDDIHFVLQMLAAAAGVTIRVDAGVAGSMTGEFFQVPWDMALDVISEVNGLSSFRLGTLVRVGVREFIEELRQRDNGRLELVRSLLTLDPGQVNVTDENGKTLLFIAAEKGFVRLAKYLLSHGGDVNARDNWNFTPLHEAANRETAEILIDGGAYLHARSDNGLTPLRAAVYGMRLDVGRYLAEKGARSDIFMDAAMGRLSRVREVVEKKRGLVNTVDSDGWTPLHHAAAAGRIEVAGYLIAMAADLNARTQKRETPLHAAVSRGRFQVVKLLIMNRAEVNPRSSYGDTPLGIAINNGCKQIANLLRQYGGKE